MFIGREAEIRFLNDKYIANDGQLSWISRKSNRE